VALTPVLGVVQIGALQIANAYVIWAEAGLQLTFFGFKAPVTWLQSIDGAATSLAILATLAFWSAWRRRRPEPDEMTKMAIGGVFLALAPLALVLAAWRTAATGRPAELGFALLFEALDNIGWVNVFAVGIALFSRVAPEALRSTMVGVYYLSVFIGSVTVGWLGSLLGSMSATNFWLLHVGVAGAAALLMVAGRRPLGRLFAADAAP
jgi:POT family proton-dependent oligopeptide transporter